jgi:hypothetical protein
MKRALGERGVQDGSLFSAVPLHTYIFLYWWVKEKSMPRLRERRPCSIKVYVACNFNLGLIFGTASVGHA